MSKLSNEYLKIIEDIEKHISNKEESKYVTKKNRRANGIIYGFNRKIYKCKFR